MEPSELLRHLIQRFEELEIPYILTGAVAAIAYGEPRLTNWEAVPKPPIKAR